MTQRPEKIDVWIAGKPYQTASANEAQLAKVANAPIHSRYAEAVQLFIDLAKPTSAEPGQRQAVEQEIRAYYGQPFAVPGAVMVADISADNRTRIDQLLEEIARKSHGLPA